MTETKKRVQSDQGHEQSVLKLHLELNLESADEDEMRILKRYGHMKRSISRDILAPADITLHALNYAIQRAFGWKNAHLHCFRLPENVFDNLTGGSFSTWANMAGLYFRFPSDDWDDLYWDDDYNERENLKTWFKKKYTGPYKYKGLREHYLINQMEVDGMFAEYNEIVVHEIDPHDRRRHREYTVKLEDALVSQAEHAFMDFDCHELIERLPLVQVLFPQTGDKVDLRILAKNAVARSSEKDIDEAMKKFMHSDFKSFKQARDFLEKYNTPAAPATEELLYTYDYGDGWEVSITCDDIFSRGESGAWTDMEGNGTEISAENLEQVVIKYRPVCIEKDGIELLDDIGGLGGFCRMLLLANDPEAHNEDNEDEVFELLAWLDMNGWKGTMISPEKTL